MTRLLAAAIAATTVLATTAFAAPLRADHPLLGTWQARLATLHCMETLTLLPTGRTRVTSGAELSESEADISDRPDAKGFYTWTDKLAKTNGKPDCGGQTTPVGDVATTYVRLDASGRSYVLCLAEDGDHCVGPYVRQHD